MGVVFEIGQTITELLIPLLQEKTENISINKVKELYYKAKLGQITSINFWQNLGFESEYPEIEREYLDKIRLDPDFKEFAVELKKNFHLAMLSNDVKEWSSYVRSKFNVNKFFDVVITSGDVGLSKPDKRIFNALLKKIGTTSDNCIFVDDKLVNLSPASELGFKTIRFLRKNIKVPFCSEFEVSNFKELNNMIRTFY